MYKALFEDGTCIETDGWTDCINEMKAYMKVHNEITNMRVKILNPDGRMIEEYTYLNDGWTMNGEGTWNLSYVKYERK